jgi:hypothetical protein
MFERVYEAVAWQCVDQIRYSMYALFIYFSTELLDVTAENNMF